MTSSGPRSLHVPVMLREVLAALQLKPGLTVMDGTVGAGGHSSRILQQITDSGVLIGFDRDPMMLDLARQHVAGPHVRLIHGSYVNAPEALAAGGLAEVDRVLLDLGLSSDQLADRDRGFGFDAGGTLDMRFDRTSGVGAAEYLARATVEQLEDVLRTWGEVRNARAVAQAIIARRQQGHPVRTADDLLNLLRGGDSRRSGPPDRSAAARVFQALRIAVNDELQHVETMMNTVLPAILKPGGIAVVLTFHSLEDRIVKQAFRRQDIWRLQQNSPQQATPAEVRLNPRSRSARLRAAERLAPRNPS